MTLKWSVSAAAVAVAVDVFPNRTTDTYIAEHSVVVVEADRGIYHLVVVQVVVSV